MITQQQIQKELELMDSFFSDGEMKQHTKNYVLIRLSSILENGIKIAITKVLEEYKTKNKSSKRFFINLSYNELKEISSHDKSIEEIYFENNRNLTNTRKINDAFVAFFNIKIFEILEFCLENQIRYEKNIESFVGQRNNLIHEMSDTTFDKEKLLEFKNILTNFLMDLQYFMHAFGELIEKDTREGKLSHEEKMQLKKRFAEIKNDNS
jgi:hypothetical protein